MKTPILIGSRAAEYWGHLPPWRNGYVGDIDLVCTEESANRLAEALRAHVIRPNSHRMLMFQNGTGIDIDYADDFVNNKIDEWSTETIEYRFNKSAGLPYMIRVAPMKVVLGLHIYTLGFNTTKVMRSIRDMEYYESLGIERDAEFQEFAEAARVTTIQNIKDALY